MGQSDKETQHQLNDRAIARQTSALGPGTAGFTIANAAYRGREVAANIGEPSPAEIGIRTNNGLGYNEGDVRSDEYPKAQEAPN